MRLSAIWPCSISGFSTRANYGLCSRNSLLLQSFAAILTGEAIQSKRNIMLNVQSETTYLGGNPILRKRIRHMKTTRESSQELHQHDLGENKVIGDWIHDLKQTRCHYGEAIFVLGPMGAGKSTVVREEFKNHRLYKGYAYVDTDEVMEKLDGFESDKVEKFYPIARSVAIRLTDWLLNEKISFIAEGTCVKYKELEDYMHRLKYKGYLIKVKHVNSISLEEILKRTNKRQRKIPDNVVQSIYHGSLKGVNELKKMNVNNCLFTEL